MPGSSSYQRTNTVRSARESGARAGHGSTSLPSHFIPKRNHFTPSPASSDSDSDLVSADGILQILGNPSHPAWDEKPPDRRAQRCDKRPVIASAVCGRAARSRTDRRGPGKRYAIGIRFSRDTSARSRHGSQRTQCSPASAPSWPSPPRAHRHPPSQRPELPADTVWKNPGSSRRLWLVQRDDGGDNVFISARYRGASPWTGTKSRLKVNGLSWSRRSRPSIIERGRTHHRRVSNPPPIQRRCAPTIPPRIQNQGISRREVTRNLMASPSSRDHRISTEER